MKIINTINSALRGLNPFSQKNSQTNRIRTMFINGSNAPKSHRELDLAKEGYEETVAVYACVREISIAFAGIKWGLFKNVGGEKEEILDHPMLSLFKRPNKEQGCASFLHAIASYYCIAGNAYIEAASDSNLVPQYLYTLRPERMTVIPDSINRVSGYKYTQNGESVSFVNDEILHFKDFHPSNDWYGLSPIAVAALSVDSFKGQQRWNRNLIENGGNPSGILTVEDDIAPGAIDDMRKKFAEMFGQGQQGTFIAEGGKMKWEPTGMSARELDFVKSQALSSLQIAQVFNVPPELIGLQPATYQNRREARKALYTEVVLPMLDRFRDDLNNWLPQKFGTEDLFFEPDIDDIEALQEDRESLWQRVNESEELTLNEKRIAKGYDERDDMDVAFISSSKIPLDDALDPFSSLPETEKPDEDEETEDEDQEDEEPKSVFDIQTKQARENRKEVLAVGRMRKKFDRAMAKKIRSLYKKELALILDALDRFGLDAMINIDSIIDENKNEWENMIIKNRMIVMEAFGKRQLRKFKKDNADFEIKASTEDVFQNQIRQASRLHVAHSVTNIAEGTKKKIRKIIEETASQGVPIDEVTDQIQNTYKTMSVGRANTIALTETVTAQNRGSLEAMNALKIPLLKVWAWSGISGEHERKGHHEADGQTVRQDDSFRVSADGSSYESLLHPGDPLASAGNRINCHCALTYRRDKENDHR